MTAGPGTGRRPGTGCAHRRRPAAGTSALAAVLAVGLAGCSGGDDADGGPTLSAQLARERSSTAVVVPAQAPPDLVESFLTMAEGYPVVSLASRDAPTVTVCTGDPAGCASVAEGSVTLRTLQVDGRDVVVAVAAGEAPGGLELPAGLADFWADVDLTTALPDWVQRA